MTADHRSPARIVVVAALAAAAAAASPAVAAASNDSSRVSVEFVRPDTYSDVRDRAVAPTGPVRDAYLRDLRAQIEKSATERLRGGECLVVNIRDIDLAGDFSPGRSMGIDSPRIVREVSVPRIDLDFQLVAADGAVVKSGQRTLRDARYLSRSQPATRDPLRYEKALLDDWLAEELKR